MPNFDIEKLLDFEAPRYRCFNCRALWTKLPEYGFRKDGEATCPWCHISYVPVPDDRGEYWMPDILETVLEGFQCSIKIPDLLSHARQLGQIAKNLNQRDDRYFTWPYPYLKALLQAFTLARSFIHFTSYGLGPFMVGALKMAAQRVEVNGVVSASSSSAVASVLASAMDYLDEARRMELRVLASERGNSIPHQKLIVIDGLLAFKGSANLHESAWRKAEQNFEQIEVVTDVSEVVDLNNRLFSSAWVIKEDKKKSQPHCIPLYPEEPPWLDIELSLS